MAVVGASDEGLRRAAAALARGELVGMPTETVYGLAADAARPDAVARVFAAKGRPRFDPLIVHLPHEGLSQQLPAWVHPAAHDVVLRLADAFWPGPLTVVVPRAEGVLDLVTAGLETVAVRVPRHPVAQALLRRFGPVVAPSANRFGRISPTRAADVVAELGDAVAVVVDGGPCEVGVESTVVGLGPPAVLFRPGGTPRLAVEGVLGALVDAADPGTRPASPGQLASHYAPEAPVRLVDSVDTAPVEWLHGAAVLRARPGPLPAGVIHQVVLSPTGSDLEAARRLFAALRDLDDAGAERIVVERWGRSEGLGPAIDDRLRRAAAPREVVR